MVVSNVSKLQKEVQAKMVSIKQAIFAGCKDVEQQWELINQYEVLQALQARIAN